MVNICDLFKKYNVPHKFDLISIDIDRNDFYVWKALCAQYSPRVIVIEFNSFFNAQEDKVIKYSADEAWDGTHYFGASILALFNLARSMGYSLVYEESEEVNLFFVRDDILKSKKINFKNVNDVAKIYRTTSGKVAFDSQLVTEKFISSTEAMNKKD